jgi:hypothetical protein
LHLKGETIAAISYSFLVLYKRGDNNNIKKNIKKIHDCVSQKVLRKPMKREGSLFFKREGSSKGTVGSLERVLYFLKGRVRPREP